MNRAPVLDMEFCSVLAMVQGVVIASEAKQSPAQKKVGATGRSPLLLITCFLFFLARAAGICSMPHITALHGGNVGPAPSMAPIPQTPPAPALPHLHILPQKSLKKDIDPLDFA